MTNLRFSIHFCGMGEETFSDQIMIYKPNHSIVRQFSQSDLQRLGIATVGQLVAVLKADPAIAQNLGEWGLEHFIPTGVYLLHHGYLLGLQKDKPIAEILDDLTVQQLEFVFFVVGGASLHNETGYRFTIHPDEKIHAHLPHVHVAKAGVEVRYSLETLSPLDPLVPPHRHDHKKIILPFLQRSRQQLLELWQHYNQGYTTPQINQEGQQFYSQS